MNETTKINNCERAGELVAYFYGEANRAERESFDAHLPHCGACRDELAAFAGVRVAISEWRAEILNAASALSFTDMAASPQIEHASVAAVPRRSALAVLREFFILSPMWLRVGTFAAMLVVCALAALAVVNAEVRWDSGGLAFSTRLQSETKTAPPLVAPAENVKAQVELDKLAAERDAAMRELEDLRVQLDDSRAANFIAAVETFEPASASNTIATPNISRRARRTVSAPAPNARQRRLRDERGEEDVPRLYDLLTEAN